MLFKDMLKVAMGNAYNTEEQKKELTTQLEITPKYLHLLLKGYSLPSDDLILKLSEVLNMNHKKTKKQISIERKTSIQNNRLVVIVGLETPQKSSTKH